MAAAVRETERKYDPAKAGTAALAAVKAMAGTAGVAAVTQQAGQLLDAVTAAEAAVPALGDVARCQAGQAKELQELLGDHHDSVVARTVLLDLAAQARMAGQDTFTYGLMHQRQACQAAQSEQALPRFGARARTRRRASAQVTRVSATFGSPGTDTGQQER